MPDEREALTAIRALNGYKLNGNSINVEVSIFLFSMRQHTLLSAGTRQWEHITPVLQKLQ